VCCAAARRLPDAHGSGGFVSLARQPPHPQAISVKIAQSGERRAPRLSTRERFIVCNNSAAMEDLKQVADDLVAKAALSRAKDSAERALEDLVASDEDKAQRETERAAKSKSRRTKLIIYGVVGLLVVVGILGMVVSYWQWFLLAGLVGLMGLYGWHRLRKRLKRKDGQDEAASAAKVERTADEPRARLATPREPEADEALVREARLREERARQVAREHAAASEAQEIEDELAQMKARLKK
jgi:hypothetical protein